MTLHFSTGLLKGRLLKRYKRFLADVKLDSGDIVTAHCPNTGTMASCFSESSTVWLSPSDDPKRKLKWTWEFSETDKGLIGINTQRPNMIITEAIKNGAIKKLTGYSNIRQEVKYGSGSRIDILLEDPQKGLCFIEVKNTTLLVDDAIMFPDAVTARGLKHIKELTDMVRSGHRAMMIYFVNRPDGSYFAPADDIDPKYGLALRQAKKAGVEIIALRAKSSTQEIRVGESLPIKI